MRYRDNVDEKIIDLAATEEDHGEVLFELPYSHSANAYPDRQYTRCDHASRQAESSASSDPTFQRAFGKTAEDVYVRFFQRKKDLHVLIGPVACRALKVFIRHVLTTPRHLCATQPLISR